LNSLKVKDTKNTRPFAPRQRNEVTVAAFAPFGLPPFLHEGLHRMGFEQPTNIQAEAIPVLMAGQDLVAQSQTGSGKTAAFAVPLLARVQRQSRDLQALIMVPTRELALQVTQVFKALAGPAVRITPIYGGAGMEGQIRGLTQGGYQVVVGTPGRLRDHLNRGTLRLDRLRMVVLDEADEMLDRGFAQDVEAILQAAPPAAQRQTALFSATLPDWVMQTATKQLRPDHASITLDPATGNGLDIEHVVYDMNLADKTFALRHLLDTHSTQPILVFARTKHGVKKLAARLQDEGYSAAGLQGNLSQRAREEVMADFRSQRTRIMVATNVGARGLDVSGISHVINFDLPESPELFTHRAGRTGRNGASGTAITFLTREDTVKWREIERFMAQNGVDVVRQRWDGPKAEPGAEPAFTQPVQRSFQKRTSGTDNFGRRDSQWSKPEPGNERFSQERRNTPRREGEFREFSRQERRPENGRKAPAAAKGNRHFEGEYQRFESDQPRRNSNPRRSRYGR
jgi:ATP-dependent RNA helicase DeaD